VNNCSYNVSGTLNNDRKESDVQDRRDETPRRTRNEKLFTALGRPEGCKSQEKDGKETAGRKRQRRRVINPRFFSSN